MTDTFISCVNELACNEQNQFISTYLRGRTIGYINITGVDMDDSVSNKNQAPQEPPQEFQATE